MAHRLWRTTVAALACLVAGVTMAQTDINIQRDVVYATDGQRDLHLDLYQPAGKANAAVVVFVHGGAWSAGSKDDVPDVFVRNGYATASVEYRLSGEAKFPTQAHDIHAAIRFLRANAKRFNIDGSRIAIAGVSAGGHLAALVGVTSGVPALQGTLGEHVGVSSKVQAILDYFGPTNFMTILPQSTPHGLSVRTPALQALLGGLPEELPDLARLASPVFQLDANDPPLLILHGEQDPQVPINQSVELDSAYKRMGLDSTFVPVAEAAHGGPKFFDAEHTDVAVQFLKRVLPAR
ncbi:MAG: alpha/beta hydrolase [Gammaproteobacteria bacterium]|nr:alpha/beta hydrolase [Gammaproteobacteria bacterium]